MIAKTLPFCSKACEERRGQIEDPVTGLPIGWCDCRRTPPENMVAAVAAANPNALDAATLIIRDVAEANVLIDGNMTRDLMIQAGLDVKGIGGAAFVNAHKLGYIEATDRTVRSSDKATRHRLQVWRSRICKRVAS